MVLLPTPFMGQPPDRVAHAAARPNILFIVTDDQRDEGTMAVMPNTRQIFQQGGTTFSNAYDSHPAVLPGSGLALERAVLTQPRRAAPTATQQPSRSLRSDDSAPVPTSRTRGT